MTTTGYIIVVLLIAGFIAGVPGLIVCQVWANLASNELTRTIEPQLDPDEIKTGTGPRKGVPGERLSRLLTREPSELGVKQFDLTKTQLLEGIRAELVAF